MIRLQQASATPPRPDQRRLDDAARRLANAVQGEVRFGLHDRMLYATDASLYQVEPLGVIIPASVEDAVRAVRACRDEGLAILPRGGGTSLAGQCTNEAVVIDFSAGCHALRSVDEQARRCVVEPGITLDDLNDALKPTGLFFAPDPSTSRHCNVGGCIGNNAAGSRSILYGRTVENLHGVRAVLADGREVDLSPGSGLRDPVAAELVQGVVGIVRRHERLIRERFPKTRRRSAGYALDEILAQLDGPGGAGVDPGAVNLAPLLCGSEGTLAVTLLADLKLRPIPRTKGLAVVGFGSVFEAIDAVQGLLELRPAAVELLDDMVVTLARNNTQHRPAVDLLPRPEGGGDVNAVLYVEFFSDLPADRGGLGEIEAKFEEVRRRHGLASVQCHTEPAAMARAWQLRKAGEPLLHGLPGDRKPITLVEDNAVPVERLGEFVREFQKIVERHGTTAAYYAHASVGVLHVRPLLDPHDPADRERMVAVAQEVAALAKSLGGVMSGEHGDGRVRGPLLEDYFGPELMEAFREVKRLFDPKNLLNPGNIVDLGGDRPRPVASIVEKLRVKPDGGEVRIPEVDTFFGYEDQHGFAAAVEMCNGSGVCRKKTGGTMCPSYMATLDERHATRGRGNALRLAISGQLALLPGDPAHRGVPQWNDEETKKTLDLCLSCKACKTECPSNVDIARLKAEYTAQGHRAAGRAPLAALAFGHIHRLNRLAALAPGAANRVNALPPVRALVNRLLNIAPERELPRFHGPIRRAWRRAPEPDLPPDAPTVVLYADTFTAHNEPRVLLAAKRVLGAFGYRVRLHEGTDAGRALISTGLLPAAQRDAARELDRLRPAINDAAVEAILVCEPSVLSSFRDDWLLLKIDRPIELRRALAGKSFLPEQFLEDRWDRHPRRPEFAPPAGRVLFHGHCHQKALWGNESSSGLLRRVFGDRVRVLDTGCCGMAGSFGYAAHRYGVSMRIGEHRLFPAVRQSGPEDVVLATGTSCRHQIAEGVRTPSLHPVEFLAASLRGPAPEGPVHSPAHDRRPPQPAVRA